MTTARQTDQWVLTVHVHNSDGYPRVDRDSSQLIYATFSATSKELALDKAHAYIHKRMWHHMAFAFMEKHNIIDSKGVVVDDVGIDMTEETIDVPEEVGIFYLAHMPVSGVNPNYCDLSFHNRAPEEGKAIEIVLDGKKSMALLPYDYVIEVSKGDTFDEIFEQCVGRDLHEEEWHSIGSSSEDESSAVATSVEDISDEEEDSVIVGSEGGGMMSEDGSEDAEDNEDDEKSTEPPSKRKRSE